MTRSRPVALKALAYLADSTILPRQVLKYVI